MVIRNKSDLSLAYSLARLYEQYADSEDSKLALDDIKREIRKYTNAPKRDRRFLDGDVDAYTVLIEFPAKIKTKEQAEQHFMDMEYRECRPSAYDCTGQAFTAWHKLVNRRNRWYCYHRVCFDV